MSDQPVLNLNGLESDLASASAALNDFANGAARRASEQVSASFEEAGARIARALGRAATDGESSFKQLAKTVLEELAKIALNTVLGKGGASLPLFGARATGGSVTPGGAFLVGETGPELFVPNQSGVVTPAAAGAVSVHFHLGAGADAASIARSQGQIAAAIARAVAYGRRSL
ncbi:MAG TPA: phage tail tape measure C-terminal domain-containing protein [Caulobacterales bacterium]|nr:phage tail tape measure C-terminal domain-containing protein [Caulobacterales bacterium]